MTGAARESPLGRSRAGVRGLWGWAVIGALILAAVVTALIVTFAGPPAAPGALPVLSSTPAWILTAPPATAAVFAVALWNRIRGEAQLARWFLAASLSMAAYHLGSALASWLERVGSTSSWLFPLACAVTFSGWSVVLGLLQACALVAARRALGSPFRTAYAWIIVTIPSALVTLSFLFPAPEDVALHPEMPLLLPREIVAEPAPQSVIQFCAYAWMISLVIVPTLLWVGVARERGIRRQILARVSVGAMMPAAVVMLCGVLALLVGIGSDMQVELSGLSFGFAAAGPITVFWLSATVREAAGSAGRVITSPATIATALLWVFYALGVMQVSGPLAALIGGGTGFGVVVTTLVIAVSAVPWWLFVRWCARRIDPSRHLAALVVARAGQPGALPPAALAEHAVQEALGEPSARLLIARPAGGWADVDGHRFEPPAGDARLMTLVERDGIAAGALLHTTRYVDMRPIVRAIAPLVERAALEAELLDRQDRLVAERRRADASADEARQRIERDLHDGVQGRLVSLGLGLSLSKASVSDPTSRLLIDETVTGLHDAVAELRELASGTLPRRLATRGLAAAVDDLVGRVPVDVELRIDDVPIDRDVEAVAYFVIAEALTNAVKHASARRVGVTLSATGGSATLTVSDDGVGGADMRAGSGLRGLSERVHAVGGRLIVSERTPTGTLLEAVLPCGS